MHLRARHFGVLGAAWALGAASGQIHHVDAPERVTRAVGVYEWTGELTKPTASRFVPVSLFINSRFEDAGLYLARPVPFALQDGDLYTVERSGEPEGVLDLDNAARVVSGNALAEDNPTGAWYGFGTYKAAAAPKAAPALHRSAHLPTLETTSASGKAQASATEAPSDDGRPHMSRRSGGSEGDAGGGSGSGGSGSSGSASSGSASSGGGRGSDGDDTDRPTLARRDPAQDAARKRNSVGGKKGTASVTAVGPQPGDDPDRPTLSHKTAAEEGPKPLTGTPADMHQAVAVSDAANRDPHPFARSWEDAAERGGTLAALQALARPRVTTYMEANHLLPAVWSGPTRPATPAGSEEGIAAATETGQGAPPKLQRGRPTEYKAEAKGAPAGAGSTAAGGAGTGSAGKTAGHSRAHTVARPPAKPVGAPLSFHEEELRGFTLSYGGLPTFVYTASAAAVATQPEDLQAAGTHPVVFVTVVAQRLPSGELQVALASVTDSGHLDRGARLRLIDAVDPDASHRASLLFELRGGSSRQFALYRLTSAKAENTFTSAAIE